MSTTPGRVDAGVERPARRRRSRGLPVPGPARLRPAWATARAPTWWIGQNSLHDLIRRDTLLDGLNFYVYRIDPATADSEATFASITSQFVPEALIDSIHVPDTLNSGLVRTVLRGADVAKVALPVEGDGVLAIGVAMSAPEPSGARLGALLAQSGPTFISYVTVDTPDTGTVRKQTLTAQTTFNTYVLAAPRRPTPTC